MPKAPSAPAASGRRSHQCDASLTLLDPLDAQQTSLTVVAAEDAEAEAVEDFLSRLPHHSWRTGKYQLLNTGTPAPFQICAFRLD